MFFKVVQSLDSAMDKIVTIFIICLLIIFVVLIAMFAMLEVSLVTSNSNVFVNTPYFDDLMHRVRGADGHPWGSPSQVLATTNVCVVFECVYCFVRYLISRPILGARLSLNSYRR